MYTPQPFAIGNMGDVHALIRAHPFSTLITYGLDGIAATHLPAVLKTDGPDTLGRIECHIARANPQWKTFKPDEAALMIFQGPAAYIRPSWYPSKAEHGRVVPTWNYTVAHAYGQIEIMDDPEWLLAHVAELSQQQEQNYAAPWAVSDAPQNFIANHARAIVGIRFTITRLEGKLKMSQNQKESDRKGVARGLADRGQGQDEATAELVSKLMR